jgi:hypothetical protein
MGRFTDITADTARFRILEYFLEARETDHAISDVIELTELSRSSFYAAWPAILALGIVKHVRTVGKTKLYQLDKNNAYAKQYLGLFTLALRERIAIGA